MSVAVPVIDYIDAINRRIYLLAGVTEYHPVTDIYHEVRNLRRTNEALRPYDPFVTAEGNVPKNVAGTKRTPRYAVFQNCKVVLSGDTLITGEQLLADATGAKIGSGPDCIDKALSPADAYCDYTPSEAEVIQSGSGLDAGQDSKLTDLYIAHYNRRKHDKTANTVTIYAADGTTPLHVFDAPNDDLSDIIPQ
jgi:hypothetical protein